MTTGLNRRNVIGGATAAALGLPVLAACGSDDTEAASDPSASTPSSSPSESPTEAGSESPSEEAAAAAALAATADIPVGGCVVFADQKCVIAQPSEGTFKAFTSVCTHQGCTVSDSTDGVIPCNCHNSHFSLEDGSVLQGPATAPLDEIAITVEGDAINLA